MDTSDAPSEVVEEFETSLDSDIEKWTEAIRRSIAEYEEQGGEQSAESRH